MSYPCGFCKKDYSSPKRLEKHKCSFCFFCQRSYSTKQKYDSHSCVRNDLQSLENFSNSNHVCEWCKKGFSSLNYLASHKCPYCSVCDHIFASYQKYDMHKRKCTRLHALGGVELAESVQTPEPANTQVITDYKCELCKKYFSSPKYLATHKCAYCEPCKRSFATFQKFRMHRLKCTRSIHLYESNPDVGVESRVPNENASDLEGASAGGSLITRTVISQMAMLELLRRRSVLSSMNDLMLSPGITAGETSDIDDRPGDDDEAEDLTLRQKLIGIPVDSTDQESTRCLSGKSTNFLLSRLSVRESPERSLPVKDQKDDGLGSIEQSDGRTVKFNSPERESDECVKEGADTVDFTRREEISPFLERTLEQRVRDIHRRTPESVNYNTEMLLRGDYQEERISHGKSVQYEPSAISDRTFELDPNRTARTDEYPPYEASRLCNMSPHSEKESSLSPKSNERICNLPSPSAYKLPDEDDLIVRSGAHYVAHSPHITEPSDDPPPPAEQDDGATNDATLHQRAMLAQLMVAVRSRFLLTASSHLSNHHHFLDDSHDSLARENLSEMPRAKLIDSKPRGRMSAYAFFVQTCREEHKKKHPDENVVFSEFSRKCADRWKTMTDKEKNRFYEMAEKDKDRYENEMKGYRGPRMPRGSRKRRNRKDPNAPKRSLSAFFWFCNDERPKVRAINPEMGVGEVAKQLGAQWGNTPPEVKEKYEQMAEYDKARYEKEMKAFKEGNFGAKKQKTAAAAAAEPVEEEEEDDSESEDDDDDDEEEVE